MESSSSPSTSRNISPSSSSSSSSRSSSLPPPENLSTSSSPSDQSSLSTSSKSRPSSSKAAGIIKAIPIPVLDFFMDAFAGTLGGIAGVWVGSPLDVMKTRIQAVSGEGIFHHHSPKNNSSIITTRSLWIVRTLQHTLANEGIRALFKGSLIASLGQGPNNFIVFGTYGATLDLLLAYRTTTNTDSKRRNTDSTFSSSSSSSSSSLPTVPTYTELYLAGLTAGLLQSFALTPFEYVKVQQQLYFHRPGDSPSSHSSFHSSSSSSKTSLSMKECIREIINIKGPLGLFRGLAATLLRDAPTYGIYFASFEGTKRFFTPTPPTDTDRSSSLNATPLSSPWIILLGGAVAGISSWTLATPVDVLKSNIQAQAITAPSLSMRQAAQIIYTSYGVRGFFRGLGPIVIRSIPTNAVTFLVYEYSLSHFQQLKRYSSE